MFNLLHMDCRRLVKSRSFYITLSVVAVLIVLVNLLSVTISDPDFLDSMEAVGAEINEYDRQTSEFIRQMGQLDLAQEILGGGFLLLATGIGVTVFFSQDFTSGYVKNIGTVQPSRKRYVLEKVVFTGLYSGVLTVLSMLLTLGTPILVNFYPRPDSFLAIAQYTVFLWLPSWAFGLMALFMVLLSRNNVLGILMSLASGMGLTAALSQVLPYLLHLPSPSPYFLSSVVRDQCITYLYPSQMQMILLCSAGWGLAYFLGSLLVMEKRDI